MPITWRNINAPDFTSASRILDSAGDSVNRAINDVSKIQGKVKGREKEKIALDSQHFLDNLNSTFGSPEELRAAQESGAVADLRNQYGQLDPNATGSQAVSGLVSAGQRQTLQDNQFNDSQRNQAAEPALNSFNELLAGGNFEGARDLLNTEDLGTNETALYGALKSQETGAQREEERLADRYFNLEKDRRREAERGQDREQAAQDRARRLKYENENRAFQAEERARVEAERAKQSNANALASDFINRSISDGAGATDQTQNRQNLYTNLIDGAGLTPVQAAQQLQAVDSALNVGGAESPRIAAQRQAALQSVENDPRYQASSTVQWLKNPRPPAQALNEVLEANKAIVDDLTAGDRNAMMKHATAALNEGYDFNGQKVKLSPEIVSNIIKQMKDGDITLGISTGVNSDFDEVADRMLKNNPAILEDLKLGEEYQRNLLDLSSGQAPKANLFNSIQQFGSQ